MAGRRLTTEVYIGDGVYASCDGYQIKLRTQREMDEHVIYIDPDVWGTLKIFAKQCGMEPGDTDNG